MCVCVDARRPLFCVYGVSAWVCMYGCMDARLQVCMPAWVLVGLHAYMYVEVCMRVRLHVCMCVGR